MVAAVNKHCLNTYCQQHGMCIARPIIAVNHVVDHVVPHCESSQRTTDRCNKVYLIANTDFDFYFRDTSPVIIPSIYSASPLPVMYTDFDCDGSETHVTQCLTQRTNGTCSESAFVRCFSRLSLFIYSCVQLLIYPCYM